jgi:hypothetical protein
MTTRMDVNLWMDTDTRAFAVCGKLMPHITLAKSEYGRGVDVFFPEGTAFDKVQAAADAINAALAPAKVEEPADV